MIVQAAPPATWKNSSGHSLLDGDGGDQQPHDDRDDRQALERDDLEVKRLGRARVLGFVGDGRCRDLGHA